jgi:hypothetical protein
LDPDFWLLNKTKQEQISAGSRGRRSDLKVLFFLVLGTLIASSAFAGLCESQSKDASTSGRTVLSCNEVDFGVRAISADYQKRQTEPVSIFPDRVRSREWNGSKRVTFAYINEIPGIRNSLRYNPIVSPETEPSELKSRGHSLLYKFNLALLRDKDLSRDREMMNWLRDPDYGLLFELTPDPHALQWEGRCDLWAAWSIDPEVRRVLDQHGEAALCHDVPFTRGELKELVSVLYSRSEIEKRLKLKGFFGGAPGVYGASAEDANLALIKLGDFGRGSDFTPEGLAELGSKARAEGKNLIFDIDPGEEVWNQPIEALADITYLDSSGAPSVEPAMIHYASTEIDTLGVREKLVALEAALLGKARMGRQVTVPELCVAAESLAAPCLKHPLWLSEQVDMLRSYQRIAVDRGILRYSGALVERHALVVQYGVEGAFARTQDEPSRVKVLEYTRIGAEAFWSPRAVRLSEWCGSASNPEDLRREERNSLISGNDRNEMCSRFRADPSKDRNLILGALPPGKVEYFRASPLLSENVRSRAYRMLRGLIEQCQSVDSAARFVKDFESTLSRAGVSSTRVEFLRNRYLQEKGFLEPGYVVKRLEQKLSEGYSPGFDLLLDAVRE